MVITMSIDLLRTGVLKPGGAPEFGQKEADAGNSGTRAVVY
jgi:hypothetical protein